MKDWYHSLEAREQKLVLGLVAIVAATICYLAVWEPLHKAIDNRQASLLAEQEFATELANMSDEANALRAKRHPHADRTQDLLTLTNAAARRAGLANTLKRSQPDGESRIQLWFENVGFDELTRWLHQLTQGQGVEINSLRIDRQSESGRVDARIVLDR